jgi:hypothetical protein
MKNDRNLTIQDMPCHDAMHLLFHVTISKEYSSGQDYLVTVLLAAIAGFVR